MDQQLKNLIKVLGSIGTGHEINRGEAMCLEIAVERLEYMAGEIDRLRGKLKNDPDPEEE